MKKNDKKPSPLSPHITIYKPQITSMMSIFHRITGILCYFGLMAAIWLIFTFVYYDKLFQCLNKLLFENVVAVSLFFLWIFCLFFHLFNGIRYLFWGFGVAMEMKSVRASAFLVIFFAVLFTVLSIFYAFY